MLSAQLVCEELHKVSQPQMNGVCASQAEGEYPHHGSQVQGQSR